MNKFIFLLALFSICLNWSTQAKTICSMTFNSTDEKDVFISNLAPLGYKLVELVPNNKDPKWFNKACAKVDNNCDILIISGHFGGLFFGEQTSSTLSINDLMSAREQSLCPNILDKPKAVYLMGCNTLASKTPDKRSVSDYLHILVSDGFPQNLAEDVTAARYLNFGQSMALNMSSIFNHAQMIVGFDSTGPLGAEARPRLEKAFKSSSLNDKNILGLSKNALQSAFSDTHLKVIMPSPILGDNLKQNALSSNDQISESGWISILSKDNINRYYDFIIQNQTNKILTDLIASESNISEIVYESMLSIFKAATGLSHIQIEILDFFKLHQLINLNEYNNSLLSLTNHIVENNIDYISADQLCSILKDHRNLNLLSEISSSDKNIISNNSYRNVLYSCANINPITHSNSKAYNCLMNKTTYDWACLTQNPTDLDVESCALAKSRNNDSENADDMLWFCYSKMLENHSLDRASCLDLTHHFSILGNQLKMNWNCLNRLNSDQ